ncbi:MAG: type IV pilin protein [Halopseudomonas yangmingensis]|uniref:Type IV pilus assembly protein PilE n=1 Tax=Halopseudomonas yangmingensis TaxID=1720063 RepID=A0A1I4P0J3_9GAMM|nr:type IV pilin protein [Halopseudomonas yangmingensis]SFM21292.1 type IV pilus assembly protein PilE [Halopseudomonas yangmingensis]
MRQAGFSLIEMLLVLAVIAIVCAIAWPSYDEHLRRAQRADMLTRLQDNAWWLEQGRLRHGEYRREGLQALQLGVLDSGSYRLSLEVDPAGYRLLAEPQGRMQGDRCGPFSLDHLGQRQPGLPGCWLH